MHQPTALKGDSEVGEGPHETACIRMQSRLHGEVLVGFLVFRVFLFPDVVACAGAHDRITGAVTSAVTEDVPVSRVTASYSPSSGPPRGSAAARRTQRRASPPYP